MSLVEAAEASFWLASIVQEIVGSGECNIECRTDSQSLYNAVYSMTSLLDKRLRVDMAILREMVQRNEIQAITWIPTSKQIADCLTKRGSSSIKLLEVLHNNQL